MDIPLAYIIFDIMISLKKNNRDTMIYRDILIIYLKRFINSFDLDKDVLEDLIFDFNFANELSFFLDDYEDYFCSFLFKAIQNVDYLIRKWMLLF